MSTQFLQICGPIQRTDHEQGWAELDLNQYQGEVEIPAVALLLEGVHQAAVRVGRLLIPQGTAAQARVLPVTVQKFTPLRHEIPRYCRVFVHAVPFGHAARVRLDIQDVDQQPVAVAELTVAKL